MSVPLNIDGLSRSYNFDYTSTSTSTLFNQYFNQLVTLGNSTGALSANDLTIYNATMINLAGMLQGQSGSATGSSAPLNMPLTAQQARGIGTLIEFNKSINVTGSFGATHYFATTPLDTVDQLTQWRDLFVSGFSHNVQAIQYGSAGATKSLQSYIELEYISSGNSLIYGQLSELSEAIKATDGALQTLKGLQLVMNRAAVIAYTKPPGNPFSVQIIPGPISVEVNQVPGMYKASTSTLKQPLKISVDSNFASNLLAQGQDIITGLQNAITALLPYVSSDGGPANLAQQMQQILADIQQGQPGASNQTMEQKFAWWVIDNHNVSSLPIAGLGTLSNFIPQKAGTYQNNLETAITTAQSFNTQQNVNLKQTVFVFQEFYKSACAMMKTINTITKTMAQHQAS